MVSVCMASFNGARFIKQQIDSILMQISDEDEIIISDDGSTDGTIDIIKSIKDSRIILVSSSGGALTSYNFLNALKHAKGDYILLSDQDDIWLPGKVKIMLSNLVKFDLVAHDANIICSNGLIVENSLHKQAKLGFFYNLIVNRTFTGCCMGFKREILSFLQPFPPKYILHDWWIASCAQFLGLRVVYIEDMLVSYRRHEQNVSNFKVSKNSLFIKIKYRFILLLWVVFNKIKYQKAVNSFKSDSSFNCKKIKLYN